MPNLIDIIDDATRDLAAQASPDITADYVAISQASDSTPKKVLLQNLVGTVLAALRAAFTPASSSAPASLAFAEDTDNGAHKITVTAPASIASDKTQTLQDVSGTIALTKPRSATVASSATPTPDADTTDHFTITALAEAAELQNPTGTPSEGQPLIVRIKDDGTARALTFDTLYRAIGATLPTTTVISKTMYIGMIYNNTDTKWDVLSVVEEA